MVEERVRAGAHHCHPSIGISLTTSLFEVKASHRPRQGRACSRARRASHMYYAERTTGFQVAAGFTPQYAVFRILAPPGRTVVRPACDRRGTRCEPHSSPGRIGRIWTV